MVSWQEVVTGSPWSTAVFLSPLQERPEGRAQSQVAGEKGAVSRPPGIVSSMAKAPQFDTTIILLERQAAASGYGS